MDTLSLAHSTCDQLLATAHQLAKSDERRGAGHNVWWLHSVRESLLPLRGHLSRPDDSEFLHPEPQCVRMQAEHLGCVSRAVDAPVAALQHILDVLAFDMVQPPWV